MTREHKLALILAFSVLLVVGLLVGDHFSKARKPQGGGAVDVAQAGGASPSGLNIVDPTAIQDPSRPQGSSSTPSTLTVPDGRGGATVENTFIMGQPRQPGVAAQNSEIALGLNQPGVTATGTDPAVEALRRRLESMSGGANTGGPETTGPNRPTTGPGAGVDRTIHIDPVPVQPPVNANPQGLPISTEKEKMHPVAEGETLYGIAKATYGDGSLWEKLAKYNGARVKGSSVRVGVTLRLPPKDVLLGKAVLATDQNQTTRPNPPTAAPRTTPAPAVSSPTRITSVPVTAPARAENGFPRPLIQDNSQPASPEANTTKPAATARPKTYTVKAGDTLGKIAGQVLGSSKKWEELLDANTDQIESPEELKVGMVLKIPAK